jgi:hypothetical protein
MLEPFEALIGTWVSEATHSDVDQRRHQPPQRRSEHELRGIAFGFR